MLDNKPTPPNIVMIDVAKLHVNDFNMNRMTEEEFGQYVAEVRRLGRLPKPAVVRPAPNGFDVVDGEHGLKAALTVGLAQVACEIVTIGDFEAMVQCYKRNRGGHDDPVLLGRLFQRMMKERGLSIRGLAREIDVAESTARPYLEYAKAAELRGVRAPDTCVSEVSALSQEQAKVYCKLPDAWRDLWLDNGAEVGLLTELCEDVGHLGKAIANAGLDRIIDGKNFRSSLRLAWQLILKRTTFHRIPNIDAYIGPITEIRLGSIRLVPPADVLDCLPYRHVNGSVEVPISVEGWDTILRDAAGRTYKAKQFLSLVHTAVWKALREATIASSDRATSSGVPNTAVILTNDRTCEPTRICSGTTT